MNENRFIAHTSSVLKFVTMTSDPFESVIFTLVKKNNKTIFRAVKTHDSHLVLKVFFHGQQIPNLLVVDFKERRL